MVGTSETSASEAPQSPRRALWTLALLSFSALFWELALIRWVPGSVRVVGYFTNLILIASFLGLGVGALLSRHDRPLLRWWPLTFGALVALTLVLGSLTTPDPSGEHIWQGAAPYLPEHTSGWLASLNIWIWESFAARMQGVDFYVVITLVFLGTAAHFVLIGHRIGRLFAWLPPLRAYSFDLAGSIAGVLLFSLASRLSLPPIAWFAAGVLTLGLVTPWRGLAGGLRGLLVVGCLVLVGASGAPYAWSPYYKIEVAPVHTTRGVQRPVPKAPSDQPLGYRVRVNNDYHQMALNLAAPATEDVFLSGWKQLYDLPYKGERAAGDVLVVGAGTGNDVQAALRAGARSVTAVEIDPTILTIGRRLHPERPYDDPRVHVVVDDARSFLKRAEQGRFDTVVFGFLDSHTLLSSLSTLRIDNYVYTVQSFREAMNALRPSGRLAVTFTTATPWLKTRLFGLMTTALGHRPETEKVAYTNGRVFWGERAVDWRPANPASVAAVADELQLPTDDWPFLYLEQTGIPAHYLYFMAIVVLLGLCSFGLVAPSDRRLNLQFFFLGAGFLLLETRSVTEIALLFGSTWAVNAIAFCSILVAVLVANMVVQRWPRPPVKWLYLTIVGLLIAGWLLPAGSLYVPSVAGRLALCGLVIFSPILLAGLVFSSQFRGAASPNLLFGSNLIGAMVGGALEYTSLAAGLGSLYMVGALLYLCAMLAWLRQR